MSYLFPVEAAQVMLFARAIGDPNPIYSEARYAAETELGGVIAPPTFVQSSAHFDPDCTLRPRSDDRPWVGTVAGEGVASSVEMHAEQHFEFHRPVRPGEVLTVRTSDGRSWEKASRRYGRLLYKERITEYLDAEGAPVVSARAVLVYPDGSLG